MKTTKLCAILMFALGTLIAIDPAFGQGDSPTSEDTKAGYGSAAASPQPGNANKEAAAPDSAKGTVEVKLTEFKIEMPDSVSAGATTFKVTNAGKRPTGSRSRETASKRK